MKPPAREANFAILRRAAARALDFPHETGTPDVLAEGAGIPPAALADGEISGYRWGRARKAVLIALEAGFAGKV